jgi:hypothetical protein
LLIYAGSIRSARLCITVGGINFLSQVGSGRKGLINGSSDDNHYKAEIERLQKIIGKQAIQIEILKKTEELLGTR